MGEYDEFGAAEREGWSNPQIAERYVAEFATAADQAMAGLVAALPLEAGQSVLDLCCGQGTMSAVLSQRGFRVTGLDISASMLAIARRQAPQVDFQEGDAQNLPFHDASFDAVVSNMGIMHLPDQPRALAEARRVLRPGGILAITAWCGPDVSASFRIALQAIQAHGDPSVSAPPQPDFFQFARREGAEDMLGEAGFELVAHEIIECAWQLAHAWELFEIYAEATVRMRMIISLQPKDATAAIRQAMTQAVERDHAAEGGYRVPIPAALVIARA